MFGTRHECIDRILKQCCSCQLTSKIGLVWERFAGAYDMDGLQQFQVNLLISTTEVILQADADIYLGMCQNRGTPPN